MDNWYYYNVSGEKIGPIPSTVLKELARQGLVTKETRIENSNGRSALAKSVASLFGAKEESALTSTTDTNKTKHPDTTRLQWCFWTGTPNESPKIGPLTFRQIVRMIQTGSIKPSTWVTDTTDDEMQQAGVHPITRKVFQLLEAKSTVAPAEVPKPAAVPVPVPVEASDMTKGNL